MKASFVPVLLAAVIGCVRSVDAAEILWTNTAGGTWSVAANWSPNQVPTGADVATITNQGTYTVTLDVNAVVIGFQLGGDGGGQTLLVSGPTLTVNGPFGIGVSGFLSMLAGTIGGTGNISVAGVVNVFGGSFAGSGALLIGTNGQLQINGNVNLGGRAIENAGQMFWTTGDLSNGRSFTNRSTGTFDILISGNYNQIFSCTGVCVNAGLIRGTSGTSHTATFDFPFNNAETVLVQKNLLVLYRGGNHTGAFTISPGATLGLGFGQGSFDFTAGCTITGEGDVIIGQNGGISMQVNVDGIFHITGATTIANHTVNLGGGYTLSNSPLSILGGVANFNSGRMLSPSTFTMSGGTMAGGDSMTITGAVSLTGGNLSGTGVMNSSGTMALGAVSIFSGTINNGGQATHTAFMQIASNAVFNNLPSGVFDFQGTGIGTLGTSGTHSFNNAGVLRKSNITANGNEGINVVFNNSGTVEVHAGSFFISAGGTHSGSFQVDAGTTLEFGHFGGGSLHSFSSGSQIIGSGNLVTSASVNTLGTIAVGGSVSIKGGTNTFSGSYSNGGMLWISGGIASFNTTQPISLSQLNVSGGTLGGNEPLIVNGPMVWTGGTIAGPGPIGVHGPLELAGTLILNGGTVNNFGAAVWSSGSIFTGGGSVISNAPGATFAIAFDGQTFAGFGGMRTFLNAGLLRKTAGAGTAIVRESILNSGTIEVQSGTLEFGNTFVQSAGTTLLAGGNLAASVPLQIQAGSLAGSGTVGANVVSSGRCIPGGSGVLRINGDYTQTSGGHLDIELGGTTPGSGFDQLQVSGKASLGGSLNVTALNGFHPRFGQTFRIVTFASHTGDFSIFNDLTMAGLIRSYDASGLDLTATNNSPALSIARLGQHIVIAWPTNPPGYRLQSTTNLPSTNWVDVVPSTNPLILTPEQPRQFFRLLKP